ncbi:MAG TPA: preprotein translocase subunit YajC [Stellaceae bacterium]|nr:preprotein translocase subunit YajC [Stellaceae bacterium]
MFISPAFAQAVGGPQDTLTTFILPMGLIFVVFYFFMIRPQQQKQKDAKKMLEALRRGDKVVTAGGLIGTIAKVDADEVQVEISEGVRVRVVRTTISSVLTKPEPVAAKKAKDEGADKRDADKKSPEPAEAGGVVSKEKRKVLGFLWR